MEVALVMLYGTMRAALFVPVWTHSVYGAREPCIMNEASILPGPGAALAEGLLAESGGDSFAWMRTGATGVEASVNKAQLCAQRNDPHL